MSKHVVSAHRIGTRRHRDSGVSGWLESSAPSIGVRDNRLLAAVPRAVMARLGTHLQLVHLQRKEMLFQAYEPLRHAYFPETAVVSLVSQLESGKTLEVGVVGRDGLAGTAVVPGVTVMPCDGIVLIPGLAHRIDAAVLRREVLANESLQAVAGGFAQVLLARSMQMSMCNMFHAVEQRCIRSLLTLNDLFADHAIPLTHELLATILGVHRPTVTLVLRSLHRSGLIDEGRGRIIIRDWRRLEAACCECYAVMCQAQQRLCGY